MLNKNASLIVCSKCKRPYNEQTIFRWSVCSHPHCLACSSTTFNRSLEISNSLPQCQYPNCTQKLKIKEATSSVWQHKCSSKNIEELKREQYFIFGAIRNIVTKLPNNYQNNIPEDIIKLVHDYYNLRLDTISACDTCASTGYQYKQEPISRKCVDCHLGMKYIECSNCKGMGYKSFGVNTGSGYANCFKQHCITCKGAGKITSKEKCAVMKCEAGVIKDFVMRKYECEICKGKKYLLKLDFIKLFNKQILCLKCKTYSSMDQMMYWSTCGHSYCMGCFKSQCIPSIKWQVKTEKRIPICPETNCDEQFAEHNIKIIEDLNKRYPTTVRDLKKLYGIKQTFECRYCRKHHSLEQLQTCGNCNGEYGMKCASILRWKDCAHLCCLDCADSGTVRICFGKKCTSMDTNYKVRFECEICKKVRHKGLFLWTNCKHTYCINCVEKYFGKQRNLVVIEANAMFYARKRHLKHMGSLAAPVCFRSNCNELLAIDDYISLKN